MGLKKWLCACIQTLDTQDQSDAPAETNAIKSDERNTPQTYRTLPQGATVCGTSVTARMVLCQAVIDASTEPVSVYDSATGTLVLSNAAFNDLPCGCMTLPALFALDPGSLQDALTRVNSGLSWKGLIQISAPRHSGMSIVDTTLPPATATLPSTAAGITLCSSPMLRATDAIDSVPPPSKARGSGGNMLRQALQLVAYPSLKLHGAALTAATSAPFDDSVAMPQASAAQPGDVATPWRPGMGKSMPAACLLPLAVTAATAGAASAAAETIAKATRAAVLAKAAAQAAAVEAAAEAAAGSNAAERSHASSMAASSARAAATEGHGAGVESPLLPLSHAISPPAPLQESGGGLIEALHAVGASGLSDCVDGGDCGDCVGGGSAKASEEPPWMLAHSSVDGPSSPSPTTAAVDEALPQIICPAIEALPQIICPAIEALGKGSTFVQPGASRGADLLHQMQYPLAGDMDPSRHSESQEAVLEAAVRRAYRSVPRLPASDLEAPGQQTTAVAEAANSASRTRSGSLWRRSSARKILSFEAQHQGFGQWLDGLDDWRTFTTTAVPDMSAVAGPTSAQTLAQASPRGGKDVVQSLHSSSLARQPYRRSNGLVAAAQPAPRPHSQLLLEALTTSTWGARMSARHRRPMRRAATSTLLAEGPDITADCSDSSFVQSGHTASGSTVAATAAAAAAPTAAGAASASSDRHPEHRRQLACSMGGNWAVVASGGGSDVGAGVAVDGNPGFGRLSMFDGTHAGDRQFAFAQLRAPTSAASVNVRHVSGEDGGQSAIASLRAVSTTSHFAAYRSLPNSDQPLSMLTPACYPGSSRSGIGNGEYTVEDNLKGTMAERLPGDCTRDTTGEIPTNRSTSDYGRFSVTYAGVSCDSSGHGSVPKVTGAVNSAGFGGPTLLREPRFMTCSLDSSPSQDRMTSGLLSASRRPPGGSGPVALMTSPNLTSGATRPGYVRPPITSCDDDVSRHLRLGLSGGLTPDVAVHRAASWSLSDIDSGDDDVISVGIDGSGQRDVGRDDSGSPSGNTAAASASIGGSGTMAYTSRPGSGPVTITSPTAGSGGGRSGGSVSGGVLPRMLDLATKVSVTVLRTRGSASRLGQSPGATGVVAGTASTLGAGAALELCSGGSMGATEIVAGPGCSGGVGVGGGINNSGPVSPALGMGRLGSGGISAGLFGLQGVRQQSFSRFWQRGETNVLGGMEGMKSYGSSSRTALGGIVYDGGGVDRDGDGTGGRDVTDDATRTAGGSATSSGKLDLTLSPQTPSPPLRLQVLATHPPRAPADDLSKRDFSSDTHLGNTGKNGGLQGHEACVVGAMDACGHGSVVGGCIHSRGECRTTSAVATGGCPMPPVQEGSGGVLDVSALAMCLSQRPSASTLSQSEVSPPVGADIEVWHEVVLSGLGHPSTGQRLIMVTQHDVSARVWAEQQLARVMEAEHALLEAIFPAHVLEHIAVMAAASAEALGSDDADVEGGAHRAGACGEILAPRPTLQGLAVAAFAEASAAGLAPVTATTAGTLVMGGAGVGGTCRVPCRLAEPPALPITGDTFLHLATSHSALTVLFCDIQGFTTMCNSVRPATVMSFLNDLYTRLDALLDAFGVYKVETIGDCYVAAGGLMKVDEETGAVTVRSDDVDPLHAHRTVQFAKALLRAAAAVRLPTSGEPVRLRVGIHSGPAMSGVVGTRMPRFCLFGDTINTASRMESTGVPGAIHVSEATRYLTPQEPWEPTGGVEAKGKGLLKTYMLKPSLEPLYHINSHAALGQHKGTK